MLDSHLSITSPVGIPGWMAQSLGPQKICLGIELAEKPHDFLIMCDASWQPTTDGNWSLEVDSGSYVIWVSHIKPGSPSYPIEVFGGTIDPSACPTFNFTIPYGATITPDAPDDFLHMFDSLQIPFSSRCLLMMVSSTKQCVGTYYIMDDTDQHDREMQCLSIPYKDTELYSIDWENLTYQEMETTLNTLCDIISSPFNLPIPSFALLDMEVNDRARTFVTNLVDTLPPDTTGTDLEFETMMSGIRYITDDEFGDATPDGVRVQYQKVWYFAEEYKRITERRPEWSYVPKEIMEAESVADVVSLDIDWESMLNAFIVSATNVYPPMGLTSSDVIIIPEPQNRYLFDRFFNAIDYQSILDMNKNRFTKENIPQMGILTCAPNDTTITMSVDGAWKEISSKDMIFLRRVFVAEPEDGSFSPVRDNIKNIFSSVLAERAEIIPESSAYTVVLASLLEAIAENVLAA